MCIHTSNLPLVMQLLYLHYVRYTFCAWTHVVLGCMGSVLRYRTALPPPPEALRYENGFSITYRTPRYENGFSTPRSLRPPLHLVLYTPQRRENITNCPMTATLLEKVSSISSTVTSIPSVPASPPQFITRGSKPHLIYALGSTFMSTMGSLLSSLLLYFAIKGCARASVTLGRAPGA